MDAGCHLVSRSPGVVGRPPIIGLYPGLPRCQVPKSRRKYPYSFLFLSSPHTGLHLCNAVPCRNS